MDSIIIVTAVILAVIAVTEIISLFFTFPPDNTPPYAVVLPVFADDKNFPVRLEYLMRKTCGRSYIVIVDYSADGFQQELCRRFVNNNPDTVFIHYTELEKYFSGVFTS